MTGKYIKMCPDVEILNLSGIRPIEDRILVRVKAAEKVTAGGIILPEQIAHKQEMAEMEASVIEVGPLAFTDYDPDETFPVKAGDTVVMTKYAGLMYTGDDKKEYRIVGLKDIVGVKS